MCLKDLKLQPKKPKMFKRNVRKSSSKAVYSQVQPVHLQNQKLRTSPGYFSKVKKKNHKHIVELKSLPKLKTNKKLYTNNPMIHQRGVIELVVGTPGTV